MIPRFFDLTHVIPTTAWYLVPLPLTACIIIRLTTLQVRTSTFFVWTEGQSRTPFRRRWLRFAFFLCHFHGRFNLTRLRDLDHCVVDT